MGAQDRWFDLFEDLEQQAAGLHLAEREAEVGELAAGEYAEVSLAARLHGARDRVVRLHLAGGARLQGRLVRAGLDWLQLEDQQSSWLVRTEAITTLRGLGARAVSDAALPVTARLSLRSALRALASRRERCLVQLVDDTRLEGVLGRVGKDFVEVLAGDARGAGDDPELVPFRALVAVREQR